MHLYPLMIGLYASLPFDDGYMINIMDHYCLSYHETNQISTYLSCRESSVMASIIQFNAYYGGTDDVT